MYEDCLSRYTGESTRYQRLIHEVVAGKDNLSQGPVSPRLSDYLVRRVTSHQITLLTQAISLRVQGSDLVPLVTDSKYNVFSVQATYQLVEPPLFCCQLEELLVLDRFHSP